MKEFCWPVRVYYEDTDHGGVVYYANYLKFMERARSEWLRQFGIEQDLLAQSHRVIFAVRSAQVDYLQPARFNELLDVGVEVTHLGKASMTFEQKITRSGMPDTVLCKGTIKIACLDTDALRPVPIPGDILREIAR